MRHTQNLKNEIKDYLPSDLCQFMNLASLQAGQSGMHLYLAGGVVRDLILRRLNVDLDLVVEGDAIKLAGELAHSFNGKLITHTRFNTASISRDHWNVDLATAREELYKKPGDLPTLVSQTDIIKDLSRRDFTINAMAIDLQAEHFGELIDAYNGVRDLHNKSIRVLHDASFQDDATRMWRAVRYEQRLDFSIEPHTLELLHRDIGFLNLISGERIRNEMMLCLKEDQPEKSLSRAKQLGILSKISPAVFPNVKANTAMLEARQQFRPSSPSKELYLGILFYGLDTGELEQANAYLKFPRETSKTLKDTLALKARTDLLKYPSISNYEIFNALKELSPAAIWANYFMQDSPLVRHRLDQYLNQLKSLGTSLKGHDLIKAGLPQGLRVHGVLEMLLAARLNGEIETVLEERQLAHKISKADYGIDLAWD